MIRKALPAAFALVLGATLSAVSFAQQSDAPPAAAARTPNPQRQVSRLAKELNLTPDQAAKIEPILAERDQKIAALRANTAIAPVVAQQQMRVIQQNTRQQLSSILTPEQIQQYKSMQHARSPKAQPLTTPSA